MNDKIIIDTPIQLERLYQLYDGYLYSYLRNYQTYSSVEYREANTYAYEMIREYMMENRMIIDFAKLEYEYDLTYDKDKGFHYTDGDEFIDTVDTLMYYDFPWGERN